MSLLNATSFIFFLLLLWISWYERLCHKRTVFLFVLSLMFLGCFFWTTIMEGETVQQKAADAAELYEKEAIENIGNNDLSKFQLEINEREKSLLSAYEWDRSNPDWQADKNFTSASSICKNVMLSKAIPNPCSFSEIKGQLADDPSLYLGEGMIISGIRKEAAFCDIAVSTAFLPDGSSYQMLWELYETTGVGKPVRYVLLSPVSSDSSMPQLEQYGSRAALFIGTGWMGDQNVYVFLCN